jgi:hypothetical protein
MSKNVCIFNIENYIQKQILKELKKEEDSEYDIYCTYNQPIKRKKKSSSIRKILKKTKPKLLKNFLYTSDIIIVDILANEQAEEDIDFICQTFTKKKKPDVYKKIILISSLLTWKQTKTNKLHELYKKFDVKDTQEWEEDEEEEDQEMSRIDEENENENFESQKDDGLELKTPRNLGFDRDQLEVQTEKKQEPKQLKGVKSEMIVTQADVEKKLTQNDVAFKSNQIQNKEESNHLKLT